MKKVMCSVCINYISGLCSIKKVGVKAKKKRVCNKYNHDESKIHQKQSIPSIKRPSWFWLTRSEKKKLIKEHLEQTKKIKTDTNDLKHPITGDLSKFITTASIEEE